MNKTRQHIIKIIESYMDKNRAEGCLYQDIDNAYNVIYCIGFAGVTYEEMTRKIKMWEAKILWHYDITAVLEYIVRAAKYLIKLHINNRKKLIEIVYLWWWALLWEIPNKPLHLYTKQEEKELLELLQKLWEKLN